MSPQGAKAEFQLFAAGARDRRKDSELVDTQAWPTRAAACWEVMEYIAWYNGTRVHGTLGYRSPADFENDHCAKLRNVAC